MREPHFLAEGGPIIDRRSVSIVGAIIVVGGLFAFAGDLDPPKGPIEPTMHTLDEIHAAVTQPQCCSPRPEDFRSYTAQASGDFTVIPAVEGTNGFILTDIVAYSNTDDGTGAQHFNLPLYQGSVVKARVTIPVFNNPTSPPAPASYHFESGVSLTPGEDLRLSAGSKTVAVTASGYVY